MSKSDETQKNLCPDSLSFGRLKIGHFRSALTHFYGLAPCLCSFSALLRTFSKAVSLEQELRLTGCCFESLGSHFFGVCEIVIHQATHCFASLPCRGGTSFFLCLEFHYFLSPGCFHSTFRNSSIDQKRGSVPEYLSVSGYGLEEF